MFWVQKAIQNQFLEFLSILAHFEQKVAKTCFFNDFLKNCKFWSKFNITNVSLVKFLSENVYIMYFHECVEKLCYKIKMPKRDV